MGRDYNRLTGHGGDGGGAISSSKSKRKTNGVNGCMAAFYHLFDFPHFYFPSHHHNHNHNHHHNHLTIDSSSRSKGLKLLEESLPSTTYKDKQSLNIPVSMRVRTEIGTTSSRLKALVNDTSTSSSEICNSPGGSRTPNLVARLMGLDLLPDFNHSLTSTMSTHHESSRLESHRLSKKGTRSLPVSPRISSARKSDFDIHHRLSLQLNKGNSNKHEEFRCSRLKQDQDENPSPRDYARRIVKEIKERVVTRRVIGMDITNSVKNREARPSHEFRRDTTVSCSPRTRFSDKENKPSTIRKPNNSSSSFRPEQNIQKPKPTRVVLVSVSKTTSEEKQSQNRVKQIRQLKPINRCKKAESETRPDIQIKKREAFLSESRNVKVKPLQKKKLKKIQKSNDISVIETPQKQISEIDRPKSKEDASICSKFEKSSPQVARNFKFQIRKCCLVLEEIALMEVDHLLETKKKKNLGVEEEEEIIGEIEREIIDALVGETVSECESLTLNLRRSETTLVGKNE